MIRFKYYGPVMVFGRCVEQKWFGQTRAVSAAKAKSNLMYQYKQEAGLAANARVELPGRLITV